MGALTIKGVRKTYAGKAFIDATYEGDLMARAVEMLQVAPLEAAQVLRGEAFARQHLPQLHEHARARLVLRARQALPRSWALAVATRKAMEPKKSGAHTWWSACLAASSNRPTRKVTVSTRRMYSAEPGSARCDRAAKTAIRSPAGRDRIISAARALASTCSAARSIFFAADVIQVTLLRNVHKALAFISYLIFNKHATKRKKTADPRCSLFHVATHEGLWKRGPNPSEVRDK